MNPRKDAEDKINAAIQRAQAAQQTKGRNPLENLPKAKPKPLNPEGEKLKAALDGLVAAELALTPAERSQRHFERLMAARTVTLTLPPTHPHPLLDATIEAVEHVRANRTSGQPKTTEELGIALILAGSTDAFDALASLKGWDFDVRIGLLEQAEMELAKELPREK